MVLTKERVFTKFCASLVSRVIAGDERWIYGYDPDTKQQSSKWKIPKLPKLEKAKT
jgi:hypothetical protein